MQRSCTYIYVHYVWAIWDRLPIIEARFEQDIYNDIAAKCTELGCRPLAIGGVEDHVHTLARLRAAVSVAELAKGMKGRSSHLVSHVALPDGFFKWQVTYGAFTVSEDDVPRVRAYILNQKEHHARGTIEPPWERCSEMVDSEEP